MTVVMLMVHSIETKRKNLYLVLLSTANTLWVICLLNTKLTGLRAADSLPHSACN